LVLEGTPEAYPRPTSTAADPEPVAFSAKPVASRRLGAAPQWQIADPPLMGQIGPRRRFLDVTNLAPGA
jgi:hypothetical protein